MGKTIYNNGVSPAVPYLSGTNIVSPTISAAYIDSATSSLTNYNKPVNTFVALAHNSTIAASSTDGITWTLRTMPGAGSWRASTFGSPVVSSRQLQTL